MTAKRDGRWLQTEAPELIPVRHAAEALGIHRDTLSAMVRRGDVPSVNAEQRMFVPRQVLLDMLRLPRIEKATEDAGLIPA